MYLKREKGGRGLKSLLNVYKETKLTVACYVGKSLSKWIQAAWEREKEKEYITFKREAQKDVRDWFKD